MLRDRTISHQVGSLDRKKLRQCIRKTDIESKNPQFFSISNNFRHLFRWFGEKGCQRNGKSTLLFAYFNVRLTVISQSKKLFTSAPQHPPFSLYLSLSLCGKSQQIFGPCHAETWWRSCVLETSIFWRIYGWVLHPRALHMTQKLL